MEASDDALITWNTESKLQEKKHHICNLKSIRKQLPNKTNSSFIKWIKVEPHNLWNILQKYT